MRSTQFVKNNVDNNNNMGERTSMSSPYICPVCGDFPDTEAMRSSLGDVYSFKMCLSPGSSECKLRKANKKVEKLLAENSELNKTIRSAMAIMNTALDYVDRKLFC
jgi:hypothetical protein